jgi:hypothetical protein
MDITFFKVELLTTGEDWVIWAYKRKINHHSQNAKIAIS